MKMDQQLQEIISTEREDHYLDAVEAVIDECLYGLYCEANKKDGGYDVSTAEITCMALHLMTSDHIKILQKQSIAEFSTSNQLS